MMRPTTLTLYVVAVAAVVGCGSSTTSASHAPQTSTAAGSGPPSNSQSDRRAIDQVYGTFVTALRARDGAKACSLLTQSARAQVGQGDTSLVTCISRVTAPVFAAVLSRAGDVQLEHLAVTGSTATAVPHFATGGPGAPQTKHFEKVSGRWLVGTTATSSGSAPGEPTAATVAKWPAEWCSLSPGITKARLIGTMGSPTSQSTQAASWAGFGYMFNAFFDETGRVRQLDTNPIQLSPSQRAKLSCADTRR